MERCVLDPSQNVRVFLFAMQSTISRTVMLLRAGAIFSLAVLLCAMVPEVKAGCAGHYSIPGRQLAAKTFSLDPLIVSGSILPPGDESPWPRPRPCAGAFCSGNPALPFSSLPSVAPWHGGDWAIPPHSILLSEPRSSVLAIRDAGLVAVDHPASIFHPPRHITRRPTT